MEEPEITPAERVHRNIQNARALLRSEEENMGELHPILKYKCQVLAIIDGNYDDRADMENWLTALQDLVRLFEPIKRMP